MAELPKGNEHTGRLYAEEIEFVTVLRADLAASDGKVYLDFAAVVEQLVALGNPAEE